MSDTELTSFNESAAVEQLVHNAIASYGSPLFAWIFLHYSWAHDPRGDAQTLIDPAEEFLLQLMERYERQIVVVLRGMSIDYEEAMDLATEWLRERNMRAQEFAAVKDYVETKPRKPFPWHVLSPREQDALNRKNV